MRGGVERKRGVRGKKRKMRGVDIGIRERMSAGEDEGKMRGKEAKERG